ncbi:transmembrane protein, putative [Medicago truncatula]|uniref:Transmembrane protein, putative n=1 Tax=Medicago truncatula TaxID=3880 RepID=A0A072TR64_MEDTR|nr:transmembrane protein, putative [Medicago truncatula]
MASVSPRIEGNEIGSLVDGVPRNAGAKEGFAVCTVAAAILLLGGIAAGVEGGASSVIVVVHDQK